MNELSNISDHMLREECKARGIWKDLEDYSDYYIQREYEDRNLGDDEDCSECTSNSLIFELENRGFKVYESDDINPEIHDLVNKINFGTVKVQEILSYLETVSGRLITGTL